MMTSLNKRAKQSTSAERKGERGYTLFGLLALMTLIALFATIAAPSIQQQAVREREQEAIFRGEEVAEAIRLYFRYTGRLPTSMEQLLEGVPRGTKKIQVLRPAAAIDPLTNDEWRLIRPRTQTMIQFQRAVMLYAGGRVPQTTRDPQLFARYGMQITNIVDTGSSGTTTSIEDDSANGIGEFIGVASRNRDESIITYYGIDHHDQWVFTPLFR
ncbi:MAG: type II secretion system protein [Pyrinomonadaceae bacterium]|nr:type II secretion system protein [Pyrinomonadaceae bacterium]